MQDTRLAFLELRLASIPDLVVVVGRAAWDIHRSGG
jgi:hypothetical protein